ncbi:hypothetical protein [Streptomyces sp. NPDC052496]|uniref:hypothetical protein n=1 Tax=Streptomyces sp. NPDC052496 TaxID=3154951 RepID=UPI00341AD699
MFDATTYLQQHEAAATLIDALDEGRACGLPTLKWTVMPDGTLKADVPRTDTCRDAFRAWAEHLQADTEDLSRDGLTVLRAATDRGLPGRGRRVRIVLFAKFHARAAQPV